MPHHTADGQVKGLFSPFLERIRLHHATKHIPPRSSILDIGCGRARILSHIPRPAQYVGVDILPEVIKQNKKTHADHEFHIVDPERSDVSILGSFGVILMLAVIEHFHHPEKVLRNVRGVLDKGGVLIMTTPHPRGESLHAIGAGIGLCSRAGDDEHHILFDRENLYRIASSTGFDLIRYHRFLLGLNQLAILRPTTLPSPEECTRK